MNLTYSGVITDVGNCCSCGVRFGMDSGLYETRLSDGRSFYCPNGHSQHYGENDRTRLEKERRAREAAERRAQARLDLLRAEERSHVATKGHLTRQRKRAAAGVCPCCKRTFRELARHMKSKHPDFEP